MRLLAATAMIVAGSLAGGAVAASESQVRGEFTSRLAEFAFDPLQQESTLQ
jgi:hypothetical protein